MTLHQENDPNGLKRETEIWVSTLVKDLGTVLGGGDIMSPPSWGHSAEDHLTHRFPA